MEMEFEIIHNDDRLDIVVFKLGTVKERHEMPVRNFIFDQTITDFRIPMIELHVRQYLEQLLDAYRIKHTPELNYTQLRQRYNFRIDLYLTGLTSVTTSVIKVLARGTVTWAEMVSDLTCITTNQSLKIIEVNSSSNRKMQPHPSTNK